MHHLNIFPNKIIIINELIKFIKFFFSDSKEILCCSSSNRPLRELKNKKIKIQWKQ